MRNYLLGKLGQSLAVASLLDRLQASRAMREAISRPSSPQTVLPLLDGADLAEAAAPVTLGAKQQLNTASPAIGRAIGF